LTFALEDIFRGSELLKTMSVFFFSFYTFNML
jgi:hypothetical protein